MPIENYVENCPQRYVKAILGHLKKPIKHSFFFCQQTLFINYSGEVFAGGQILNQPPGLPGKASTKLIRKDNATLASLGIKGMPVKVTKVDRLLSDTKASQLNEDAFFQPESGKLTFKSHLSETERTAVRKVANGN